MDAQTPEILFGCGPASMIGLERHRLVELVESQQCAFDYFVSVGNIERDLGMQSLAARIVAKADRV